MKGIDNDAPDGMCVFTGCQYQAEAHVTWHTSRGLEGGPMCKSHMAQAWAKMVPGAESMETFTIRPLWCNDE